MKTNCSLTIYSKSVVDHAEVWTRSAVGHALWENADIANAMRSGVLEADKVVVFIPFSEGEITIKPGDYIVKGTVTDTISSSFTVTALRAKYDTNCAVVRSVNRLDVGSAAMQHWEIGAG